MKNNINWSVLKGNGTFQLLIIMILVSLIVAVSSILIVYNVVVESKKEYLKELSENQVGIIKSIYAERFDKKEVLQLLNSQHKFKSTIGKTGEFVIGYLKNDSMYFLSDNFRNESNPRSIPLKSNLAEPMKFALSKKAGIINGSDYRNSKVLAYCTYIPELQWGIVTKINVSEVNQPFIRAGLLASLIALILVTIATFIFKRISNPIIEELVRSREEWEETFDLIPDLIAILDNDHKIVHANKAMLQKLGISSHQAEGLHCYQCVHGSDKPYASCPHSLMLKDHKQHITEIHEIKLGGDFLVSVTPILDNHGGFKGGVHVARDITDIRKKELELIKLNRIILESEEKLKLALDNGSIGVWVWNILTNEIEWDDRMEQIFGIEPGSFNKTYDAFEAFLIDEDIPHTREAIRKALEDEVPFETVYRIKLNNGDVKYISAKALVNKNEEGKPVKMTGVCFDITGMKKDAEQVLFNLNEELLRSNKELEQFAYIASHDLQEPLRMVSSFTQLLAQRYNDKLDQDAREFIKFAVDGALHMQTLINDLLAYSRIQTKGKEFSRVDVHEILGKAIYNLSIKISEKNALVTSDDLPVIFGDEGQMVQLLQNLIGNAVKFSKNAPHVHISSQEEKDHFILSVKDNGIGIEKQYFERIFQIFQRLLPKDEFEGTGIGLAICKRIVERHGGKIWVESEPEIGTTFYFSIKKFERN